MKLMRYIKIILFIFVYINEICKEINNKIKKIKNIKNKYIVVKKII
jgi:hypothetical protein